MDMDKVTLDRSKRSVVSGGRQTFFGWKMKKSNNSVTPLSSSCRKKQDAPHAQQPTTTSGE